MEETCFFINESQHLEVESNETGVIDLMDSICRLCAKLSENLLHLFSEPAIQKSLVEKINLNLPLEVKVCDALPLHICNLCIIKVEVCHEIIQTSLTSQTQLIELFAPLIETKLSEDSNHSTLETSSDANNTDLLIPNCDGVEQNDITIDQTDSTSELKTKYSTTTNLETSQSLVHDIPNKMEPTSFFREDDNEEDIKMDISTVPPFMCEPCDLKFDDVDRLNTHLLSEHSSSVLCCWDCNILFYNKVEYEDHILLHGEVEAKILNCAEMAIASENGEENVVKREVSVGIENLNTLGLNIYSEVDEEVLTALSANAFDQSGIYEAGTSEEVISSDIGVTEDLFEDISLRSVKKKLPVKTPSKTSKDSPKKLITADVNAKFDGTFMSKPRYSCIYCKKTYAKKWRSVEHENFHTHEFVFTCNVCENPYYTKSSLRNHLYTHNEDMKPLACEHEGCTARFIKRSVFDAHVLSHTQGHNFGCDICPATFKQKKGLMNHKVAKHSEVTFACTVCPKTYKSRYLLTDHARSHVTDKLYTCGECGMEFHQANRRNQHMAVHATERKHKCHLCASAFKRASHLAAHVKRHARLHPYKCTACDMPFDSLSEVSAHRKTHTESELDGSRRRVPPRPPPDARFRCPVCDKLLLTKVTLQNHLALHTDVKPYQCDLCDQSFTAESHLTNHRVIHSGMKPFPCQYCPLGFMCKEEREAHERTHAAVNPYVCEFCNEEFSSKMSLNQHLAVHADVRRHACEFCEQRFRRRDTLDAHIRTHTGERPFGCSFCKQSFKQKGDCTMHERKAHKDQVVFVGSP